MSTQSGMMIWRKRADDFAAQLAFANETIVARDSELAALTESYDSMAYEVAVLRDANGALTRLRDALQDANSAYLERARRAEALAARLECVGASAHGKEPLKTRVRLWLVPSLASAIFGLIQFVAIYLALEFGAHIGNTLGLTVIIYLVGNIFATSWRKGL